jgi:hypothetical protein
MTTGTLDAHTLHEPLGVKTPKKAALASWIGSALEYYDFFIIRDRGRARLQQDLLSR